MPSHAASKGHVPLVEVIRAGRLECVHYGSVAICDARGGLLAAHGNPEQPTFLRSSAKPFQAVTVVRTGAADRWGFTAEELALCCASHGAQPLHLTVVHSMLAKCGLTPDDLRCGPHAPMHTPSADALVRDGKKPEPIHNNCSGKHAGMLAVCRHQGWPTATYLSADHPLQRANVESMAAFAGLQASEIPLGVDGCGVPTFYLPLARVATAFARLACDHEKLGSYLAPAQRIVQAMAAYPVQVSTEGHFGAQLLQHVGKHVVGKGGAEGVFGAGLIGKGVGVAIKISDGGGRAIAPVMVRLLEQLLPDVELAGLKNEALKPICNTLGDEVGELRVVI